MLFVPLASDASVGSHVGERSSAVSLTVHPATGWLLFTAVGRLDPDTISGSATWMVHRPGERPKRILWDFRGAAACADSTPAIVSTLIESFPEERAVRLALVAGADFRAYAHNHLRTDESTLARVRAFPSPQPALRWLGASLPRPSRGVS